ncbi:hypothetical protein HF086_010420 [Spodoptera exigua]|uniref:Carboxypeptidase n=1 Tax=Spodoptera exigua TaxID=7107 RepID=A0A922SLJ9_SPOEX|nr:hypothetical protein HF086_010420 [Spodoptera exigua]
MLAFLEQFLMMFPEIRSAPLFVVGESYAGKYVPALGIQIHRHNKNNPSNHINLKVCIAKDNAGLLATQSFIPCQHCIATSHCADCSAKPTSSKKCLFILVQRFEIFQGIAIGNGLVELRQMMHYSTMCSVLGVLEGPQIEQVEMLEKKVIQLIDAKKMVDAANTFNETIEYIKKHTGISVYNFMEEPSSGAPDFEEFINRTDVKELIHVGNATFILNNQLVYQKMLPDFANTTKPFIEELLEHYGVLAYNGQLDMILGYSLSKHMYDTLKWSRRESYFQSPRRRLRKYANGSVVGYKKAGGNFVDVLIRGAGHMVPADQPEVAKFIIDSFIEEFKK